jgi:hypothetical protein
MVEDGAGTGTPTRPGRGLEEPGSVVAERFEAVAPVDKALALVEQTFEFDESDLRAVLRGLTLPLSLLVGVEIALDAVDLAVEEVDDGPGRSARSSSRRALPPTSTYRQR